MESESFASQSRRRALKRRRVATEAGIAAAFVLSLLGVRWLTAAESAGLPLTLIAAALPVIILTIWWIFYAVEINRLDELERAIETRSIAIACAVTVWLATGWGIFSMIAGVPGLPLFLTAPLAAVIYGVIRAALAWRYR